MDRGLRSESLKGPYEGVCRHGQSNVRVDNVADEAIKHARDVARGRECAVLGIGCIGALPYNVSGILTTEYRA
jgi:hypothetical protein